MLDGRNVEVIEDLGRRMEEAAAKLAYEQAARLRDQIQMLKQIQATQVMTRMSGHDIDAVGIAHEGGEFCVSVVFVRGGRNLGSSNYFPKGGLGDEGEMLAGFLAQYYLAREAPSEIVLSRPVEGAEALEQALAQKAGHAVQIRTNVRGTRARWIEMARNNAALGLKMRASSRATVADQLEAVGRELSLGKTPQRIECFDVSHSMGESAVASCVVLGPEGPLKSDYRRFNLRDITPGDDYAGIEQAVERRFARVMRGEAPMPDLLLIDGGLGQLHAAHGRARARGRDGPCRRQRRQGVGPQGRAGAPVLSRAGGRAYTRRRLAGPASDPARARRSASFCDHRSPAVARSQPARIVARGDSRPRAQAPPGIAEGFWRAAGHPAGVGGRPGQGARHQPAAGRRNLRTNESWGLTESPT